MVNVIEAWTLLDVVLSVVTEGRPMIVGVGLGGLWLLILEMEGLGL